MVVMVSPFLAQCVCPPAGEGEASTRCLWALCVSLGLDSDCSALLGSSGAVVLSSSPCRIV